MNKPVSQRQSRPLLLELAELFANWPMFAGLRNQALRMEDETRYGYYLLRTELPGVDPVEDLEVTVRDGRLAIVASRREPSVPNGRLGVRLRHVRADRGPARGADEEDIHATYDRGILTVSVPLTDDEPAARHIEVVETILIADDDDLPAERSGHDQQEQPVG